MFTRGDETSVKLMMEEFQRFSDSTELKANPAKCKVFFGRVLEQEKIKILMTLVFLQEHFLSSI